MSAVVISITSSPRFAERFRSAINPEPLASVPAPLCRSPELALFVAMLQILTPKQRRKTREAIEELVRRDPDDVSAQTAYQFVGRCL